MKQPGEILQTLTIPATITHIFDWQKMVQTYEPAYSEEEVSGKILSTFIEKDNLTHIILQTVDGLVEVQGYAGFLFPPSPDGRMAVAGEDVEMVSVSRLGGHVRKGWQNLSVTRAFAPVAEAWAAREQSIKNATILPTGLYDQTRVTYFFSIVFEDELSFLDEEDLEACQ